MNAKAPPAPPRAPWHLWLVGVLGALWNAVGVFDFFMMKTRSGSYMARLSP